MTISWLCKNFSQNKSKIVDNTILWQKQNRAYKISTYKKDLRVTWRFAK